VRFLAALFVLAACGDGAARAKTAEQLLAPWIDVKLGEPPGERPGFEANGDMLLQVEGEKVVELDLAAGKVVEVALEWREEAAHAAERSLRDRLPAPRECAGAHREIAEFKPILWQLADGSSVSAIRKGKIYRLSVRRPASEAWLGAYAACKEP
jgi:hypothetical protein